MNMVGIIDKLELCVKHYYYTIFGVPKMLTHSGIGYIQTLNRFAFKSIITSFQLDHSINPIMEVKWEVFFPEAIQFHEYRPETLLRDRS
jgi:hypothetical protein